MSNSAIARAIAHIAHRGQKYGKRPYMYHVSGVASMVYNDTQGDDVLVSAAWLHDVLEDTDITLNDLLNAGVSTRVLGIVTLLTHNPIDSYEDYIRLISQHRGASRIKLADLEFNLGHEPKPAKRPLYLWAQEFLKTKLARFV